MSPLILVVFIVCKLNLAYYNSQIKILLFLWNLTILCWSKQYVNFFQFVIFCNTSFLFKKSIFSIFRKAGKLINLFLNNRGKNTTLDVLLEMQIVCCFKSQEYRMLAKTHTPKANLLSQFDIIHIGWLTYRFISYVFRFTITGNIFLVQSYYFCQILC